MANNTRELANEINKILAEYAHGVGEEVEKVAKKVALDGVKKLKQVSPKKTGNYARGWKASKVNGKWTVHNRIYRLTHLLEKGHAKVQGGRVAAQVHIAPVEEDMIKAFINGVEEVIRR